jgi:molybdate-binding protein
MIPIRYKERYKMILHKEKITKDDLKQFREAVKHFKMMYPEWEDMAT